MRHPIRVLLFACDVEDARLVMKLCSDVKIAYLPSSSLAEILDEIKQFKPKLALSGTAFLVDILSAQSKRTVHIDAAGGESPKSFLSSRDATVLEMLVKGRTNEEIAQGLHLSPRTVKRSIRGLCELFHAANRTELAGRAVELLMLKRRL